jgi:hypothetical protein
MHSSVEKESSCQRRRAESMHLSGKDSFQYNTLPFYSCISLSPLYLGELSHALMTPYLNSFSQLHFLYSIK